MGWDTAPATKVVVVEAVPWGSRGLTKSKPRRRLYQLASTTHFTAQSGQGRASFGLLLCAREPASQPRFPARSTHSTIVHTPERESVSPQCFRTHLLTRLGFWVHSCSDAFLTDKCVSA